MKFTDEDIKLIKKFVDIKNRGYYANGTEVTEVYNRVLEKRLAPTNCGSCIRQRICELEGALTQFERKLQKEQELASEGVSDAGVGNAKGEENKTIVDETGEQNKSKKAGRPRKK
jgi:hypothetical protein